MSNGRPVFEVGLVMAGAISAGAYTAGVVDFLIEALDQWEEAKADGYAEERAADPAFDPPRHDVRLKVMSGASAGSMVTALAAISLAGEFEPCRDVGNPPAPARNRLFDSWVRRIDIARLLGTRDLDGGGPVPSLLDSTALDEIVDAALEVDRRPGRRPYVADPLALHLSVTNLRGVPYGFRFAGEIAEYRHAMTAHKDNMAFTVSWNGATAPGAVPLDAGDVGRGDAWDLLGRAALASGAFPVGLAARRLERPGSDYDVRAWPIPEDRPLTRTGDGYRCECVRYETIRPSWPAEMVEGDGRLKEPYVFVSVDGGVMNNEPLELARRSLAGEGRNPRDPRRTSRAVIMIDPFPNEPVVSAGYDASTGLVGVITGTFFSLIRQARFKMDELVLAEKDDVASRFVIAPARRRPRRPDDDRPAEYVEPAMASAIFGGFGGFFSPAFRAHDFQLGRRNCQRFLERHFALPLDNPLFAGRTDRGAVTRRIGGAPVPCLPIVPLLRTAREPVPRPAPVGSADYRARQAAVEALIRRRTARLGGRLASEVVGAKGVADRLIRCVVWPVVAYCWANRAAVRKVRAALDPGLDALDKSYREG